MPDDFVHHGRPGLSLGEGAGQAAHFFDTDPVTRDPAQAVPIGGSYFGEATYLGMEVDVAVRAEKV